MSRINILVALVAIFIHGGAAFCATSFLSCPTYVLSGWKQQQQYHPRLSGMADGNSMEENINGHLASLDLRTGYLLERMITSNLKSKKYFVRHAYDIVELISPQADRLTQRDLADRINDHLFQNCTRDLLNEIIEKEIPFKKYIQDWTDEDVLNANAFLDEKINDNHKRSGNFRWSWERAAYQQLQARKGNFRDDSPEWLIISQFMRVIEAGFPDNSWKTKKPVFIANEEHDEFNYQDAKRVLISNRKGLLPSLMFADSLLKDWNYKGDNNWAMWHIYMGSIRHDYAKYHSHEISIIEVNSSTAGRDKANDQLLFRAHLLDEYARIAWDGSEDKTAFALNLEAHLFDSNDEVCFPPNYEDGFKIAYPVWMNQIHY